MRPIKFRAWDKETNSIRTSKYFKVGFDGAIWPSGIDEFDESRFILMQFTGLHDKNGKEIYEGDILTDGQNTGAVEFEDGLFALRLAFYLVHLTKKHEVLGNIYENPELLKKEK